MTLQWRHEVRKLIQENDWQLLSEDIFVDHVAQDVKANPHLVDGSKRNRCINVYCHRAWYPACLGVNGDTQQHRGYEELRRHLLLIAQHKIPQYAEDATQDALITIHTKIEECRNPGAFLRFAIDKLRNPIRKHRQSSRSETALDSIEERAESRGRLEELITHANSLDEIVRTQLEEQFVLELRLIEEEAPKLKNQLKAVQLRYLEQLDNQEIASIMDKSAANVAVMINRGIARLRKEPKIMQLAEQLFKE